MKVHGILFDVDGTLLDSSPAYTEMMFRACRELGWPLPAEDLMQQIMTFRRSPLEVIFGAAGVSKEREQALFAISRRIWSDVFETLARPFPDTLETLQVLWEQGFRLGIVTDANHEVARRITGHPDCPPMDVIVTREESGVRKPSPIPIEMALRGMGLHAESVVYIGDNPSDMQAGKAAGVRTIGITTGPSGHDHLHDAGAERIVRQLAALPNLVTHRPPVIEGVVRTGIGQAGSFTGLHWVQSQLLTMLGASPWPGTLNLEVSNETARVVGRVRSQSGLAKHILQPEGEFCRAICHEIELYEPGAGHFLDGLVLWPELEGYPDNKLELICSVRVRDHWQLQEGQPLRLRYREASNHANAEIG